jgi:hypothetical protein
VCTSQISISIGDHAGLVSIWCSSDCAITRSVLYHWLTHHKIFRAITLKKRSECSTRVLVILIK